MRTCGVCVALQAKVKEKIDYCDLSDSAYSSSGAPPLKLARLDPYLHGPTPVVAMQYNTSEDMISACQAFTQDLLAWQPQITQVGYTLFISISLLLLCDSGLLVLYYSIKKI